MVGLLYGYKRILRCSANKQLIKRIANFTILLISPSASWAKGSVPSDMTQLSNSYSNDKNNLTQHGGMSAYIQNISYCKRFIKDMKTYQKESKECVGSLIAHLNEKSYKRLLWLENLSIITSLSLKRFI
ncbi:hypothetical protein GGR08_001615 [Bartonella fuyuanensis]|uniref:Uncharacterized protein n=1 Tax=Bartonella fuyuanensis TaxID=1460968 RepID=A0A840DVU6_9HYPH|nr:hypothetical protein [Bartonella fuyuanensis]MBB4077284.1 hypothetical protein [Bartonella fuyuanensis]